MIELPLADPGRPDTRSPVRLLLWVGRQQIWTLVVAITFGVVWMVAQALMPFAIGQAIQQGVIDGDNSALLRFASLLLVLGVVQAAAGVMRHRFAVQNWLLASYRLAQLVGHHAARTGDAIRGRLSTGEVVATVSNDALRAGGAFDVLARLIGGIFAYVIVAVILLSTSVVLGLMVLLGVPLLEPPRRVAISAEDRARYVGVYSLPGREATADFTFFERDGELFGQVAGQGANAMIPYGNHAFGVAFDPNLRITFTVENGRATRLVLLQGGRSIEAPRKR